MTLKTFIVFFPNMVELKWFFKEWPESIVLLLFLMSTSCSAVTNRSTIPAHIQYIDLAFEVKSISVR